MYNCYYKGFDYITIRLQLEPSMDIVFLINLYT